MIDYPTFKGFVLDNIKDFLPETFSDAEVRLLSVSKINNGEKEGLIVRKPGNDIAPTLYLDSMYEHYEASGDIATTMTYFATVILNAYDNMENVVAVHGTDDLKEDHIVFELVNTQTNAERLKTIPHREYMDLSIVYRYRYDSEDNIQSVLIDNDIMASKGYNEEQLYQLAYENTEKLLPSTVVPMVDVIREIMMQNMPETTVDEMMSGLVNNLPMVVISNSSKSNGVSAMLYENVLDKAANLIGGDCYILPSSIHELIAVPGTLDTEELSQMVCDINQSQVRPNERLSNNVYRYDKNLKQVLVAVDNTDKQLCGKDSSDEQEILSQIQNKKMSM